jgi:septum formation protein
LSTSRRFAGASGVLPFWRFLLQKSSSLSFFPSLPRFSDSCDETGAHVKTAPVLVLASASPRRSQLLKTLGVRFVVLPCVADEPQPTREEAALPARFVEKTARFKAAHCNLQECGREYSPCAILAADTIVWHDGEILGKPQSENQAREMLHRLRGKSHTVFTGVCLRVGEKYSVGHEATLVQFGHVSDEWIETYVATGEPLDKAGAYAAQGKGAVLVERIAGDFWNVVGLPLNRVSRMLAQNGMPVEKWWGSDL